MPGYSTNKGTTRPDSRPGKRQQNSLGGISGQEQQTQHDKGGCSPATALAVFGAKRKRKRSEASASERGYTQQADESTSQTTGVASVVQPSNAAASDQQKAKQSPASLPSKSKSNSKRPKSRFKSLDSEYDPEDEIPLYTLAQKQKPATPVGGRHSDSKQQVNGLSTQKPQQRKAADSGSKQLANGFSTQSTQRNAAAAASAVAFFGTSRRGQGKPLSPLAANSGLPPCFRKPHC